MIKGTRKLNKTVAPSSIKTSVTAKKTKLKGKSLNKKQRMEVVKIVQNRFKPELKHYDNRSPDIGSYTDVTFNGGAGAVYDLSLVVQEKKDTNKIGDVITLESIYVKMHFIHTITATVSQDVFNLVRAIIFQWKEDDATLPTGFNILQIPAAADNFRDVLSPLHIDKSGKYKVLYDKTFLVDQRNNLQVMDSVFIQKGFDPKIQYTEASDRGLNHIYLLVLSDSANGSVDHPKMAFHSRIRYYDM